MSETQDIQVNDRMIVADPLAPFSKDGMLKIIAPAKTNLYLDVGFVREDGFHEVKTILHSLSIHDVLHMDYVADYMQAKTADSEYPADFASITDREAFERAAEPVQNDAFQNTSRGLVIEVEMKGREGLEVPAITAEENLVYRAIHLLAKKIGRNANEKIKVRIEKHIPHQAGLGGGSSDAAAALIGAAYFWGLDKLAPEVVEAAAELGSDIAFFLHGGCAYFTGKGEAISHELEPMKKSLVLVRPEGAISTAEAYRLFDSGHESTPENVAKAAQEARKAEDVPFYNNLTDAAAEILPEISEVEEWGRAQVGVEQVLLSGSGSVLILQVDSFDSACLVSSEAQKRGWWARVTTFSPLGAAIIPQR